MPRVAWARRVPGPSWCSAVPRQLLQRARATVTVSQPWFYWRLFQNALQLCCSAVRVNGAAAVCRAFFCYQTVNLVCFP